MDSTKVPRPQYLEDDDNSPEEINGQQLLVILVFFCICCIGILVYYGLKYCRRHSTLWSSSRASIVDGLEIYIFQAGGDDIGFGANSCSICLDDFENGESLRVTACRHLYHENCLKTWVVRGSNATSCPQCRENISREADRGTCITSCLHAVRID
ncbi:RING-H2 finger protein ATL52-like [Carya illinoinensis]|uniref:RING-H2 finger protein ATL52-like n=1 Tax=Carya illinoinensis TaxID=32201 RepID=UPI001C720747|nr:RING-H2 finger protein ATL52-like [Carya illinoinensis]